MPEPVLVSIQPLLEQIAEDERVAKACPKRTWTMEIKSRGRDEPEALVRPYFVDAYEPDGATFPVSACEHAARWDPARVLAECAVRRRILQLFISGCEISIEDFKSWISNE